MRSELESKINCQNLASSHRSIEIPVSETWVGVAANICVCYEEIFTGLRFINSYKKHL